jgi:hypothetical protein
MADNMRNCNVRNHTRSYRLSRGPAAWPAVYSVNPVKNDEFLSIGQGHSLEVVPAMAGSQGQGRRLQRPLEVFKVSYF